MAFNSDKVTNWPGFDLDLGTIASGSTPAGTSIIDLLDDGSIYYKLDLNGLWSSSDRLFIYDAETTYGSWSYSGNDGTYTNGVWFDGVDVGTNDAYFTADISVVGDTERTATFDYYDFTAFSINSQWLTTPAAHYHVTSLSGDGSWNYFNGSTWNVVVAGTGIGNHDGTELIGTDQLRFTPNSTFDPAVQPAITIYDDASNSTTVTYNQLTWSGFDVDPVTIAINWFDTSLGTWQYSTDGGVNWLLVDTGLVNSNTNELSLVLSGSDLIRMVPFGDLSDNVGSAITFYAAEYDEVLGSIGGYTIAGGTSYSSTTESAELTVTAPAATDNAPVFRVDYGEVLVNLDETNGNRSTDEGRDVVVLEDGSILVAGGAYRYESSDYTYKESSSGVSSGLTIDAEYTTGGAGIAPDETLTSADVTLTASHGTLTSPAYQWYKDGAAIGGATSDTLELHAGDAGSVFSVIVTHSGGVLFTEEYASLSEEKSYEGDYGLVKLNADGTLDSTFSGDGILLYDPGTNEAAYALDLQADGQIWVAGYSGTDTDSDGFNDYNRFRLLEVNPTGSSVTPYDYTPFYDGGGYFPQPSVYSSSSDFIGDIEVLLGSDWVVAGGASGWSEGNGDSDYAVRYYDQDGVLQSTAPDNRFSGFSGFPTSPVPYVAPDYNPYYLDNHSNDGDYYGYGSYTQQGLTTLTEDASGRILAAGTLTRPNGDGYHPYTDYYLVRLTASNGDLDISFSSDGWLGTDFTGALLDVDIPHSVISLPDGKVLVVGQTDEYVGDSILVSLDEGVDANFGLITTVDTDANDLNDHYEVSLTIDNSGDYTTDGNTTSNGLAPLTETGGVPDQAWLYQWQYWNGSWSNVGGVTSSNQYPAVLTDTVGYVRVQVYRVDPAIPDIGAGTSYTILNTYQSQQYAVDFTTDYDTKVSLLRTDEDGVLDTTFGGGDGKILLDVGGVDNEFIPQRAVLDNDGNILVAGYNQTIETVSFDIGGTLYYFDLPTNHMQVIRLDPDGALDTTFGDGGIALLPVGDILDFAYGIAVQPDDRIVITGSALAGTDQDLAVVRLNADGTLDSGFGGADAPSDGELTFVENGPAVLLYENLGVYDTEQDLKGDYDGATLVVERTATVNALDVSTPASASGDDQFSGSGELSFSAGDVIFDGTTVGTYNTGSLATGTLDITFNSNATPGDVNGVLSNVAYSNSSDNPDSVLSPPESVVLTFTFTDNASTNSSATSKSDTVERTVNITPANDAPSPFTVSLSWTGTANSENSTVSASVTVTDPDGNGTLKYQWQSSDDGGTTWLPIASATSSSFIPDDPQVDKILRVAVSYVDGGGTTESTTSGATGTILNVNDLPTGFTAGVVGDTEGDTLSLSIGTPVDPDGLPALPAGYSYQWQVSPTGAAGTWFNISGALNSTLLAGNDESGQYVRAEIKYTDLRSTEESTFSGPVFIKAVNDLPVNFVVTIDDTTPTEESMLTATASVDSDGDGLPTLPAGFTFQWQSSPNGTSGWVNIAGATSATFTPDDPQVDDYLRVIAKYQDLGGTVEQATSTATSAVTGINDLPSGLPTITGTQVVGYTLGVNTSGISDVDGLSGTFTYQWYREAGAIDTLIGSSSTYTLTPSDLGEQVYVRVSYTDLQLPDAVESVDSALSSAVGSSNTTGGVTIDNDGTPAQGETVSANTSTLSDPDGLRPFSYQWYRSADAIYGAGDTVIAGATGVNYTLVDADVGSYIFVVVSYTDGGGHSEVIPSSELFPIADINAPGQVVINGSAVPLSTLGLSLSDPDGVGTIDSYLWERSSDGISWSSIGTGSTQALTVGDLGYQIRVTVTYDDLDPNLDQVVESNPVTVVVGGEFGGIVYFWNDPHTLLGGITVNATSSGSGVVSATTNSDGEFSFGLQADDEYIITAADDGTTILDGPNDPVTLADALAALQIAAKINPNDPYGVLGDSALQLSPYQLIAADVDGDGRVTSADAWDIFNMAVDADGARPNSWLFVNESHDFWDETSEQFRVNGDPLEYILNDDHVDRASPIIVDSTAEALNLVAIVRGDVNGSWASTAGNTNGSVLADSYFTNLSDNTDLVPTDLWGF